MKDLYNKVIETAREAGIEIMKFYLHEISVHYKSDDSPITQADLAAHHLIVDALKGLDLETPVISEESGVPNYKERRNWAKFWLVDPLDGTKEFIKKNGEFTVNIALIENGKPVFGVVYAPALDVIYYGQKDLGSFKIQGDEAPKQIFSEKASKEKPLSIIESRTHGSDELEKYLNDEHILIKERIKSGSSLKFCLVAEGKADIYPRLAPTMEWDVAAGDAVYRYSAKQGVHESGIQYNKENLLNPSFIIGF